MHLWKAYAFHVPNISKLLPTVSPSDLPCHRQWRELTVALRAMSGSHFAGGGGTGCVARARCDWSTAGACGLSSRRAPVPSHAPHGPPPARAPLPGAQCSCAAVAHRLPRPLHIRAGGTTGAHSLSRPGRSCRLFNYST